MTTSFSSILSRAVGALAVVVPASTSPAAEEIVPLPRIVVTATPSERPLTVTLDPKAAAQPMPAHDGAEALRAIPGFAAIRKGGTDGDPVLRGMAGSRLGILLDGENILGGCGNRMDPPTAYVFPSAYDRITVLKGPQSVLHGPGNSAGVVLFERAPRHYTERGASLESALTFGSFGRNDQFLDARAGTRSGYLQVAGTRTAAGDYEDGAGQPAPSGYERWSTHATAGWTPDADTRLELSGILSDGEAAYADRTMDGVRFSRENLGVRIRRARISPLVSSIEASGFFNSVDHVMDNYTLRPFVPSPSMPGRAVSNPDRRTFGGRAAVELVPTETWRLTTGADYQGNRHRVRSSRDALIDPYTAKRRVQDAGFETFGVFAETTHLLTPTARVIGGARADFWLARDERVTVPLGMAVAVNPTALSSRRTSLPSGFLRYEHDLRVATTAYLGFGHAQRFPDYWELFNKEGPASLSAFHARPERTTQIDLGLTHRAGVITASLSLFANRVDDFILVESGVSKPAGMGTARSATIARNVATRAFGGEASVGAVLGRGWYADVAVAGVRGENRTDQRPLAQQPPLETRAGLSYARPGWSLGSLVRFVNAQRRYAMNQGNIVGTDIGETPGFAVLSLNAGWKPRARMQLSAGVDNVSDKTYAEHLSRRGSQVAGFPAPTLRVNEPGRTFWVKWQMRH